MERRYLGLKTTTMALFMLLSVVLLSPVFVADETEETSLWGRVLDSNTNRPIESAKVTIKNLQSGNQNTIITQEDGRYRLEDTTGYFTITASHDDYFDAGEGHSEILVLKGDVKRVNLKLDEITKDRKVFGNVTYYNGSADVPLNHTTLTLYCTAGPFMGYQESTTNNATGYYEFEVFNGTFLLMAEEEDYVDQVINFTVNETHDREIHFNMTEGETSFEIFGYAEDNDTGVPIEGIDATLTDTKYDRVIMESFSSSDYFEFEVYPSTFDLILDADGYHPYVEEDIVINETEPTWYNWLSLEKDDTEEEMDIDLTLDINFTELKMVRDWTLNSDSGIPGLATGAGNLKMKIDADERFGDGDGELEAAERIAFQDWYTTVGPASLYTDSFFKVNGTGFEPGMLAGDEFDYRVLLYGFDGDVMDVDGMRIKTTMTYVTSEQAILDEDDAFKLWLGDLGDEYVINFNNGYEIVTEPNEDWDLFLDDNDEAIPYEARIFNATTIEVFEKMDPVANITVTLGGATYYPGDEIFAGSASDDVVMKTDHENITFDASESYDKVGEIVNYTWNFGDSKVGYGKKVTHNYTLAQGETKPFTVTLTVRDSANETVNTMVTITVDAKPPTLPDSVVDTPESERNQSDKVKLNASKADDDQGIPDSAGNYIWEFWDGTEKFGKAIEHIFHEAGTAKVNLTVKDRVGNFKKGSYSFEVKDTQAPIADILASALSARVGEKLVFNTTACSDNVDTNLTFEWNFGTSVGNYTSNIVDETNVSVSYKNPGAYVVTLNVTDKSGNQGTAKKTITVTAPDLIVQKLTLSDKNPEEGEKIEVEVIVKNIGSAEVDGGFDIALYADGKRVDSHRYEQILAYDGEYKVNFTWEAEKDVEKLSVKVDDKNEVAEENEDNNEQETVITVQVGGIPTPLLVVIGLIIITIVVFVVVKKKRGV